MIPSWTVMANLSLSLLLLAITLYVLYMTIKNRKRARSEAHARSRLMLHLLGLGIAAGVILLGFILSRFGALGNTAFRASVLLVAFLLMILYRKRLRFWDKHDSHRG